jgi:flagellar basal body P-ring formation protein FlgA
LTPFRLLLVAALPLFAAAPAAAAVALAPEARAAIESFLRGNASGEPGAVSVTVADPASPLPPCASLQAFLPPGSAASGRVSVGVRCAGERPWTRYLAAQVAVQGQYLVAAHPIAAGSPLGAQDVTVQSGDLARLPKTVVTNPAQLQGTVAVGAIAAGAPLRADLLRGSTVIHLGQTVRVVSVGDGFVVGTDAKAMTNAAAGATLQVKTAAGRLITVVAGHNGQVMVPGSSARAVPSCLGEICR